MPLFVPFLIGVGVAAVAGYGGKRGVDGVNAMRRAKAIGKEAERRHKHRVAALESARDHLRSMFEEDHERRLAVARTTLGRMVALLQALERRGKVRTPEELRRLGVDPEHVQVFVAQYLEAGGTLKGAVAAAGAGAGASAFASTFATASTGAAISGLSGAAAESAILAWLGGGSLAVGGGGMALGTLVLGGIVVGPAVAIGGLVLAAQGEKAVTRAEEYRAEVDVAVARVDALIAFHRAAEKRIEEIQRAIRAIDGRAAPRIDELLASVDDFDDENDADVDRLRTAMLLCKALSDLLHARVLDDDGNLDGSSARLLATYRYLAEDA
jgi:hypothetical protein